MTDAPSFLSRPDGLRLAYRHVAGAGPCLVFLPGYKSDMLGGKAVALAAWSERQGRAMLRLDYSGCGESDGSFEDGTLTIWRDDVLLLIERLVKGPVVLVGSSMGGWLALLVAEHLGAQVRGVIGIAAAPDFTEWGFTEDQKRVIATQGRLEVPSEYGPEPMVTTRDLWESGHANVMLHREIAIDAPIRLLQGQRDADVPWKTALRIAGQVRSADVQVHLVKDGDHRLSRDQDVSLLIRVTGDLLETL